MALRRGELKRMNEVLEARVAERTRELEQALATLSREMTERKAAEEALRQSHKMEAVGHLTGGIAHDFNNLLTGVIGSLDLMQRRLAQGRTEDLKRYADAAMTSANRAAALTHRLLSFARRRPLDARVIDPNAAVAATEDLLRRTLSESIDLTFELSGTTWPVRCDQNQLENAILNLAINARDAMPGGGSLRVTTSAVTLESAEAVRLDVPAGQYVRVAVSDNGSGMAAEVVEHAFDPFFTTKPLGVGTGLGLPMTYSFARQSDGAVRIDSAPERGTTVSIYLPRFVGEAAPGAEPPLAPTVHGFGQSQVVLVVEDEQAVRSLVMEVLQDHGYRGMSAMDGAAALDILRSDAAVDLLLSDIGLPSIDGVQLFRAARAHRPGLPVLFITAHAHTAPRLSLAGGRTAEVMAKPFTIDQLLAAVHRSLETA